MIAHYLKMFISLIATAARGLNPQNYKAVYNTT
jgi:hypothetical protein